MEILKFANIRQEPVYLIKHSTGKGEKYQNKDFQNNHKHNKGLKS